MVVEDECKKGRRREVVVGNHGSLGEDGQKEEGEEHLYDVEEAGACFEFQKAACSHHSHHLEVGEGLYHYHEKVEERVVDVVDVLENHHHFGKEGDDIYQQIVHLEEDPWGH